MEAGNTRKTGVL